MMPQQSLLIQTRSALCNAGAFQPADRVCIGLTYLKQIGVRLAGKISEELSGTPYAIVISQSNGLYRILGMTLFGLFYSPSTALNQFQLSSRKS
jgi:hypothetical protein